MNLKTIIQFGSTLVAVISILVTYFNNKANNKTVKELELTKQKFAKENEKLKRNLDIQKYKNNLKADFLGSLASCYKQFSFPNMLKAQENAGKVLPICTPKQKQMISDALMKIANATRYEPSQKIRDEANEAIFNILKSFKYDLKPLK